MGGTSLHGSGNPLLFSALYSKLDVRGNENVSDPLGRASATLKTEDREINEKRGGKKWPSSKHGLSAKEREMGKTKRDEKKKENVCV